MTTQGSRVYERRAATPGGCDNWIERGSVGVEMLLRDGRNLGRQIFSVDIFRL